MLEGNLPQCSIYLLYKYKIIDACLKIPFGIENLSNKELIENEIDNSMKLVKLGSYLLEEEFTKTQLIFNKKIFKEENLLDEKKIEILKEYKKSIYLALLTFTFKKYEKKITKKESLNGSKLIYKESLKLSNELLREITIFSTSVEDIVSFINNQENINKEFSRLNNAKLIRKIKNPYFLKSVFLAICYENLEFINMLFTGDENKKLSLNKNFIENFILRDLEIKESKNVEEFKMIRENYFYILNKYENWMNNLIKENLLDIDNLKPIFDGVAIQKILNIKAGKSLGILMESLIEFQILKGNLNEAEAAQYLKDKLKEIQ